MTAKAACTAAFTSPSEVPTLVGGFPGYPVMDMSPPRAWEMTSKAIFFDSGPVWPKPLMLHMMIRGLISFRAG